MDISAFAVFLVLLAGACLLRAAASPGRAVIPVVTAGCAAVLGFLGLGFRYASTGWVVTALAALGLLVPLGALLIDAISGDVRRFRRRGQPFLTIIDTINASVFAYATFVLIPWDVGVVQPLHTLGIAGGLLTGAVRWFVDRRRESIAPALLAASAVGMLPLALTAALQGVTYFSYLGWVATALCGLAVLALALATARRRAERRAAPIC